MNAHELQPGPAWIIVPNWFGEDDPTEGLQHYLDRDPIWIKNYRRLLARDEYLELTGHRRGILHGLWLEYAASDGRLRVDVTSTPARSALDTGSTQTRLRLDTRTLQSRLALRITTEDLESLNRAGFIHFTASKPLALAEQRASTRARPEEREKRRERSSSRGETRAAGAAAADHEHDRTGSEPSAAGGDPGAIVGEQRAKPSSVLLGLLDELGVRGSLRGVACAAGDERRVVAAARKALASATGNRAGYFRALLESGDSAEQLEASTSPSSSHGSRAVPGFVRDQAAAERRVAAKVRNGVVVDLVTLEAEIAGEGLDEAAAGRLRALRVWTPEDGSGIGEGTSGEEAAA